MKKLLLLLSFLLVSSIASSQVVVSLQDQCKCELLSGTEVTAAGQTTPAGLEPGDLYINTASGALFYWTGSVWSDIAAAGDTNTTNQSLTIVGSDLVITDSVGGTVAIPLAAIQAEVDTDTNTTNTSLTENGTDLILTDSEGNTVSIALSAIAAATDTNTTNATFAVNGSNLEITDSEGAIVSVPLADIQAVVDTDDQTLSQVLAEGADANNIAITGLADPTNAQDAATKNYVDNAITSSNQTVVSTDANNSVTTGTDGGAFYSDAALQSSLSDLGTRVTTNEGAITALDSRVVTAETNIDSNTSNITSNTNAITALDTRVSDNASDIAANTTAITTNGTNIAANTTSINNHITADGDLDDQNELSDLSLSGSSLMLTNAAPGAVGVDLSPLLSAAGTDDQNLTGAVLSGTDLTISIEDGTSAVADLSALDESAEVAALDARVTTNEGTITGLNGRVDTAETNITSNTSNITSNTNAITALDTRVSDNASDIGANTTAITTNASNITILDGRVTTNEGTLTTLDGRVDVAETNISANTTAIANNVTNIASNATAISDHVTADLDISPTNEIQNLDQVLSQGADANNIAITGLADPTNAQDAATKNYVDNAITSSNQTVVSTDANNFVTAGTDGGAFYSDADADSTNELNTGVSLTGTSIAITDAGGTLSQDLDGVFATDAELAALNTDDADADSTNELNTGVSLTGTSIAITDAGGTLSLDLNGVFATDAELAALNIDDADADLNNEIQNLSQVLAEGANANNIAITGLADPTNAQDAATKNYVDNAITSSNQTVVSTDANNSVTTGSDGGAFYSDAALQSSLSDLGTRVTTNEGTITALDSRVDTAETNINSNTSNITSNTNAITALDTRVSDHATDLAANATNIAAITTAINNHIAADQDTDATNELQTITSADASVVITPNGNDFDLSVAAADGTETLVQSGNTNVTVAGDGSSSNPYQISSVDTDDQTLSQVLAEGADANNIAINGLADPTNAQDAATKNYVDNAITSSNQTIISTDANNAVIAGTDGGAFYNDADSDSTNEIQTLVQTGTDVTLSNGGGTISVADNDNDSTNEIQDLALTGETLTITANASATPIDLSAIDNQTASEVSFDNTTSGLTATTVQAAIDEVAANNSDDQNAQEVTLETDTDVDGDGTNETTVQEAVADMTKVTSKAGRIFYPPSVAINAATISTENTLDLYAQYVTEFGNPAVSSTGAPSIPTYAPNELYYYVTKYDTNVFANVSISDSGVMTYDIVSTPRDYNALINVVFVVK